MANKRVACLLVRRRPCVDGGLWPRRRGLGAVGRARVKLGLRGGMCWWLWRAALFPQATLMAMLVIGGWWRAFGGGLGNRSGLYVLVSILQCFDVWWDAERRLGL